jgi:NAD(P)-dependent dehydrogenase (short-subunit alcohol dehydrogenase family)
MDVHGVSAVVTGGASGLGAATAHRLAQEGAFVTIIDRNEELGRAIATASGGHIQFASVDVTHIDEVASAISTAAERGPLSVTVNCAGIAIGERTLDRHGVPADLERFWKVLRVNVVGTYNVATQAAAVMARNEPTDDEERGVIINTASIAAYEGQIGQTAYAASKGGVVGMTLPMARDLAAVGIRVNTIAPGIVGADPDGGASSSMIAGLDQGYLDALAQAVPFPKRLGYPSDYASLVIEIINNRYLNGETIRLDGALRMPPK